MGIVPRFFATFLLFCVGWFVYSLIRHGQMIFSESGLKELTAGVISGAVFSGIISSILAIAALEKQMKSRRNDR